MNKSGLAHAKTRGNGSASGASSALRVLLSGLQAMRDGDFSVRLPGDWTDLEGKVADAFNEIVAANQKMARELQRVGQVVGKEGRVIGVEGPMEGSRLVVAGQRGEVLIPFAANICVEVDVAAGRIVVNPPEGLLDLNAGRHEL